MPAQTHVLGICAFSCVQTLTHFVWKVTSHFSIFAVCWGEGDSQDKLMSLWFRLFKPLLWPSLMFYILSSWKTFVIKLFQCLQNKWLNYYLYHWGERWHISISASWTSAQVELAWCLVTNNNNININKCSSSNGCHITNRIHTFYRNYIIIPIVSTIFTEEQRRWLHDTLTTCPPKL